MKPRPVTAAPVVTSLVDPDPTVANEAVPEPEPPARRTRAMPSTTGGSMDDLFAAAAQMGRLSLREGSAASEGVEDDDS